MFCCRTPDLPLSREVQRKGGNGLGKGLTEKEEREGREGGSSPPTKNYHYTTTDE